MNTRYLQCIALSLALLTTGGKTTAQSVGEQSSLIHKIGVDIRPGYVTPTSDYFEGSNERQKNIRHSLSVHLKYAFQFGKDTEWGKLYPHAYQGIGIAYNTFFAPYELGNPVLLYAFQGSRIAQISPRLSFDYEWNFGASFGWKKYDEQQNPWNEVVGSRINAYINVGLLLNWQVASQWNLTAGLDFTHYSNGNTHYPNAGVNPIGLRVGVVRTFGNGDTAEEPSVTPSPFRPYFNYDLTVYGATRTKGIIGEDESYLVPGSFGVVGLNFAPMYNFNKYFRAGVSLDAQYDESANLKDYKVEGTYSDNVKFYRPPFYKQFAVGLSVRGELVMPIFSVNVGIGRNVICSGEDTRIFYQVLALKTSVTRNLFLHVGYQSSRFKDPNNLMLGIGYRFHGKKR